VPARLRIDDAENVVIEFDGHADGDALVRCREACDRVPHLWWKDVTVVLESADVFEPEVLELLRELSARASSLKLKLIDELDKAGRA